MKHKLLIAISLTLLLACTDETEEKQAFIEAKRLELAQNPFRKAKMLKNVEDAETCISLLQKDGKFSDLEFIHTDWAALNIHDLEAQNILGEHLQKAFMRLWQISELYRDGDYKTEESEIIRDRVFHSYSVYYELESKRPDIGRFHASCFAMPRAGINSYFCFFNLMEEIEAGTEKNALLLAGREAMMNLGYQSWTQPMRMDETDNNVVSVERFRNHVWWVGGNALAYRALFESAAMMSSIEMMDVLAEVSGKAISMVSQTSYDDSFWTEGLTADGAGWGHGMQCLVWGYPIHGTNAALSNLDRFAGSPWAQKLKQENVDCILNYLRGSAFMYYKGTEPPAFSRHSMSYQELGPNPIPSLQIVDRLLENWSNSFHEDEIEELKQFKKEAEATQLIMDNQPEGHYHGTRYFFNNDNFIKKTRDYYALVSMASQRCDGIESFHTKANGYNQFTCDGMTIFQRSGQESKTAVGAWNLTSIPGVTAPQLEYLNPITNWRGYTSKHNFAAGATHGGENGVSGFIFEKLNGSAKKDVNDRTGLNEKNPNIYDIKANKSWFWFGDQMLAMGSGISDLNPALNRPIWTCIEQNLAIGSSPEGIFRNEKDGLKWYTNNEMSFAVIEDETDGEVKCGVFKRQTFYDSLNAENISIDYEPKELDIFQLWIDHGFAPENQSYAYLVDFTPEQVKNQPKILSNDIELQAAMSADGSVIEALFYQPNRSLEVSNYWFKVSAPCALMVETVESTSTITVCDAEMNVNLSEIVIHTNYPLKGEQISKNGDHNILKIELPVEPFRGSPTSITVTSY